MVNRDSTNIYENGFSTDKSFTNEDFISLRESYYTKTMPRFIMQGQKYYDVTLISDTLQKNEVKIFKLINFKKY
ncbi:MAG TPA: hypothetical protein PK447_02930 [Ignavibacteria bacterium]|nr:hypothetical protein [Ignavibacteria bacterium]